MKQIIITGCCQLTLKSYVLFLQNNFNKKSFKNLHVKYSTVFLPKTVQKITLLKSPHVNKKAKEQFQISIYKVVITLNDVAFDAFLNYFSFFILNKPKTIKIKVKY